MTQDMVETLEVDMTKCDGHGICAWLFPDRVGLDDWGYAWVDPASIDTPRLRRKARAAVRSCPRRALSLTSASAAAIGVNR